MRINDLRLLQAVLFRKFKKLDLSVTYKCNGRCQLCRIWEIYPASPEKAGSESPFSFYEKFFAENNSWNVVSLTGGEPFLRPDIADIAGLISQRCQNLYALTIPTNALLGNGVISRIQDILARIKCRLYVNVSLDGREAVHDRLKGVPGAFRRAVEVFEGLRSLNDPRLAVSYEYVISAHNQGKMAAFFEQGTFDVQNFCVTVAQGSFRYANQAASTARPAPDLLKADVAYFLKKYKVRSFFDLCQRAFLNCLLHDVPIPCVAGKNTFYMDPYGRILRCTLVEEKTDLTSPAGRRGCNVKCYTPCESYYGLIMGPRWEFFKNIIRSY